MRRDAARKPRRRRYGRSSRRRADRVPPPPPPRRFRQARARVSYEKILRAAVELYAERDYHATQTPDIAERAGMSVGGLYRYFRDKHQIFVELMHRVLEGNRRTQDAMVEAWEKAFAEPGADRRELLRKMASAIVDWTWNAVRPAPPDLVRTYVAMSYQDEAFAALRAQYGRYEQQAFARVLAQVVPRERVPSARAAATLIDVTVETMAMWSAVHRGADSRGVKEALADMLYRYLAPPDEPGR